MVDDGEDAALADPCGGNAQHLAARQPGRAVEIERRDQVEDAVRKAPGEVVLLGVHPLAETGAPRPLGDPVDRRGRDVDGGDVPAALGQPQSVAPAAAAEVEGAARRQRPNDLDEPDVGAGRDRQRRAVVSLPELLGLVLVGLLLVGLVLGPSVRGKRDRSVLSDQVDVGRRSGGTTGRRGSRYRG